MKMWDYDLISMWIQTDKSLPIEMFVQPFAILMQQCATPSGDVTEMSLWIKMRDSIQYCQMILFCQS